MRVIHHDLHDCGTLIAMQDQHPRLHGVDSIRSKTRQRNRESDGCSRKPEDYRSMAQLQRNYLASSCNAVFHSAASVFKLRGVPDHLVAKSFEDNPERGMGRSRPGGRAYRDP